MWKKMSPEDEFDFEKYEYRYKVWYGHRLLYLDKVFYLPLKDKDVLKNLKELNPKKILKTLQNSQGWLKGIYETDEWICIPTHNKYRIPCLEFKMKEEVLYFNLRDRSIYLPSLEEEECFERIYNGQWYQISEKNCSTLIYIKNIEFK